MPKKRCGFGFDCAGMMLQPGLEPGDCPNYFTCGAASSYTDEELVELVQVREQQRERIRVTRQQAAIMMLMSRGNPQDLNSLEVNNLISEIELSLQALKERLNQFENVYIAPEQTEVHQYNVKRRDKNFWYNKLTSKQAMFKPVDQRSLVKVIHLSHDDDPRNIEARLGVERRNQLTQVRTKLKEIQSRLADALDLLE
ncbi:hypothetical protein H6F53_15840 [Trichocoleus sp. FACHB-832]|uniref:hypothetical protein n=1 Tax=Trichocoleus sp. FACHB-832 TaxID=2692875 RepID=UPI001684DE5D|nr:hypothetical protein [Trichocoleus sp. FACHB-832]MBD1906946.1 hypothetical protein [Trichocoleus sp. FACHB-832]